MLKVAIKVEVPRRRKEEVISALKAE